MSADAPVEIDVTGVREFVETMDGIENLFMKRNVSWKLQEVGSEIVMAARRMCPVRTGRLRDSIYTKLEDWSLKVGASAPYAKFIEFGTRYIKPYYFLTEAIQLHYPRIRQIVAWAVRQAFEEAHWKG